MTSHDGGAHFVAGGSLGPMSDIRYAAVAPVPFFGDYEGTAASPNGFVAVWNVATPPPTGSFHQTTWAATIPR